jgi:hypothetical protein
MMGKKLLAVSLFFALSVNASALGFFVPKGMQRNVSYQVDVRPKINKVDEVSSFLNQRCADLITQMNNAGMSMERAAQRIVEIEDELATDFAGFEREIRNLERNIVNAREDLEDLRKTYQGREEMYFNGMTAYWYSNLDGDILTDRLNVFIANANRVSSVNIAPVPLHIMSEKDSKHADLEDVEILVHTRRVIADYNRVLRFLELDLGMREQDQAAFDALNQELTELQGVIETGNQMVRFGC